MRRVSRFLMARFINFSIPLNCLLTIVFCMFVLSSTAHAYRFNTGNRDLNIRWDNTVKYSVASRVEKQSDDLVGEINQDDGDRNFSRGLISNRVDLLSEADIIYKGYGARVSAAAWYDFVYNASNDNTSPETVNSLSVAYDEFTQDTKDIHGKNAELLDAFVFGHYYFGNNALSFRGGQYALQWGESLFFGNNGIAGAMAPIDVVKLLSVPNSQFKEIIRPVPQVSAQFQIGSKLSIGAYYQLKWEETRIPAVGSYFSNLDFFTEGGERAFLGGPLVPGGGNAAVFRGDDIEADDNGQGGVQVRYRIGEYDLGAFAVRYHDKAPQLYAKFGIPDPSTGQIGEYYHVYPEDIDVYGASVSTNFGIVNFAAEVSMRHNTPLVSDVQFVPSGIEADNDDNPLYAIGDSFHAQLSWIATLEPNFISRESDWLGEIAYNRRTKIEKNAEALAPNTSKDALGIRMVYEPRYRQVLPGVDLGIPLGLAYFPKGSSSVVGGFGPDEGGDMNIGLNITYLDFWRIGLAYTHFYGSSGTLLDENLTFSFDQANADRDFVSVSIACTF